MYDKRVFVGWNNGAFVTSVSLNFQKDLEELIEQYGKPDTVEYRDKEISHIENKSYKQLDRVNRVEVIDENGRSYVKYDVKKAEMSLQDKNKTLKVFIKT